MVYYFVIIALVVAAISFTYAISEGIKRRQLINLVRSQAWDLFARSNNFLGTTQQAFKTYKYRYKDNLDAEFIESLSQTVAYVQGMFLDTIRLIYLAEPFDHDTVQQWIALRKFGEQYRQHFEVLADTNRGDSGIVNRLVKKFSARKPDHEIEEEFDENP